MSEEQNELIVLKNSNALFKYPVDADQLNDNFKYLYNKLGSNTIQYAIESSGQVYNALINSQLAAAIAQYALSSSFFTENGNGNSYILYAAGGLTAPIKYTEGMVVNFITTRTNTDAVTLAIETLEPYEIQVNGTSVNAGYIVPNKILSFRFRKRIDENNITTYYWEPVTTSSSSTQSGSGSSGSSEEATYSYNSIINFINSSGLDAALDDTLLLSKAVSTYVSRCLYKSEYIAGVYYLTSYGYQHGITEYVEGEVFAFIADASNEITTPYISVNDGDRFVIKDHAGETLDVNAIQAGDFVYCVYTDGYFKLMSTFKSSIALSNGPSVNTISTDSNFTDANNNSLATTLAIRNFVETKMQSTSPNTIQRGYEVLGSPASLRKVSNHVIQLVSHNENDETTYLDVQPDTESNVVASGNSIYRKNVINKLDSTYWPSLESGFAVDGKKRIVAGPSGSKYVTIETDSSGNPVMLSQPSYVGISGLTAVPNTLRIKHRSTNETPQSIKLEVCFGANNTYSDVVTSTGSYNYGNLEALTKDSDDYYNIPVPTYYMDDGTIRPITVSTTITLRVVPTLFNNQTTQHVNDEGYDPNNDTASDTIKYNWCVTDLAFSTPVDAPSYLVVFPDSTAMSVNGNRFVTQYDFVEDAGGSVVDENETELDTLTDGLYYLYITENNVDVNIVPSTSVYKTFTNPIPSPTDADLDSIWIDTSKVPATTHILTGESGEIAWEDINLIFIGACTVSSNNLTNVVNFRYGTSFGVEYDMTSDFSQEIDHNFGSDVDVFCQLVCTSANNSYNVGDMITLDNNMTSIYSLPTVTSGGLVTDVGANTLSYFQVINTQMKTTIKAHNLYIVNTSTNELVLLPSTGWKLRVYVTKD